MSRLCTICARCGSKGVKNKNILTIAGKPLIAHSIQTAIDSNLFELIAVSSDSDEILSIAKSYGAHLCIKRPSELATDAAPKLPSIRHAALEAEKSFGKTFDTYCDLDSTSPLRNTADITGAVKLLEKHGRGNVVTVTHARRSPYFNLLEQTKDGKIILSKKLETPVFRRQDAPATYDMNASIYVWTRDSLMADAPVINDQTQIFIMPEERSIDIDSELDLKIVKMLLEERP